MVDKVSESVTSINETLLYMYQTGHVIYTIITIIVLGILINLFQYPIPLAVHTGARTPDEPTGHGIRVPLSKRGSDQITSVLDVTIVYTILLC